MQATCAQCHRGQAGDYPPPTSSVLTLNDNQVSALRTEDNTLLPRRPGDKRSLWASPQTERAFTGFYLVGTKPQCEKMGKFWRRKVTSAAQHSQWTQSHGTRH